VKKKEKKETKEIKEIKENAKETKENGDPMEKLLKLTKMLKRDKVAVEPLVPARGVNKWRTYDPKFAPKAEKPVNVIAAGGMEVDPARKEEYENWRKDKLAEQNARRAQYHRKALLAAKERAEREKNGY
jgi:hypothetical protein